MRIRATKFRGVDVDGWFEADAGGSALIGEIAAADGVNGDWVELGPGFFWIVEFGLDEVALDVDGVDEELDVEGPGEAARDVDGPGEVARDVDGPGEGTFDVDGPGEAALELDSLDETALEVDGPGEAGLGVSGLDEACLEDDGWSSSLTVLFGDLNSPDDSLDEEKLL